MKANVLNQYKHLEWQDVKDPVVGDQDVLIQVKYAGICGTDQHIFSGEFHPRTKLPMIPGHEFGGVIVETGKQVKKLKKDDLVAVDPIIWCGECGACKKGHYPACTSLKLVGVDMDGGFGEYVAVKENMCYLMPENTDPKYAALVEVLGIGFHACNRAKVKAGDSVLIWGAGKVGNCILQAAKTKIHCVQIPQWSGNSNISKREIMFYAFNKKLA